MKLQNNFTSIEQSKHLLKIGLPANSADMCYPVLPCCNGDTVQATDVVLAFVDVQIEPKDAGIPCWSTGRLIEILAVCNDFGSCTIDWISFSTEQSPLQTIYDEVCAGITQSLLDFSKLEK